MSMIARQFAHPHGLPGRVIGYGMAWGNAALSRWVMQEVGDHAQGDLVRIAELGLALRPSHALPVRSVESATTAEVLRAGLPGGTTVEHLSALLLFTGRD